MAATVQLRPEPRHAPAAKPARRPELQVVPKRRRRLRTGPTVFLGGLITFVVAFALVVAQAMLVQGQQQLDELDGRINEATRRQQELRLQVAELESPDRIVASAQQLGMVTPPKVTYLAPTVEETPAADDDTRAAARRAEDASGGETSWSTVKPHLADG